MRPTRLTKPYRPIREWLAWRIAEIISPRWFLGRQVTDKDRPWTRYYHDRNDVA